MNIEDIMIYAVVIFGIFSILFLAYAILRLADEFNHIKRVIATLVNSIRRLMSVVEEKAEPDIDMSSQTNSRSLKKTDKPSENTHECGKLVLFKDPGEILEGDAIHIHQVLPDGNILCKVLTHDDNHKVASSRNAYLSMKEDCKFKFYDEQEISLPSTSVIFQIGIFQYSGGMLGTPVTLPAISVFGSDVIGMTGKEKQA